jgi:ABC-type antimicrobial peptide transport system permease subunit
VAVVNATLAEALWPGRSPIGRRLRFGGPGDGGRWLTVVGVVGDVKQLGLNDPPIGQLHVPLGAVGAEQFGVVVRTRGDAAALAPALRQALAEEAPGVGAVDVTPMLTVLRTVHWQPKVFGGLFGAFGLAALLLAVVGVYGMTAYAVAQRTREIGVRVALGAGARDVVALTARRGLALMGVGLAAGLALTLAAGGVFRTILFGVTPSDPAVLLGAPLLLGAVGLLATWLPARRAARVDPMVALRAE